MRGLGVPRISGHERGEHGERRADAQRCALTEDEGVRPAEGLERRMRGEDLHLFKGAAEVPTFSRATECWSARVLGAVTLGAWLWR